MQKTDNATYKSIDWKIESRKIPVKYFHDSDADSTDRTSYIRFLTTVTHLDWIGLSSVLRPHQHSIGYPGDSFTGQKTQPTVSKYWRNKWYTDKSNIKYTASPQVYTNMGWLGDGSHRGQGCQAWTAVGLPPRYPQCHTSCNNIVCDAINRTVRQKFTKQWKNQTLHCSP